MSADPHVIVAGGGPVGLTVALQLARAGIAVTVLEAGLALHRDLRASTFHAATMDLLDEVGITDTMVEQGLVAPIARYFDRHQGLVAEFDHGLIADVTRHPYRLQLEQYKYAQILYEALLKEPTASIRFAHEVVGVRPTEAGPVVTVRTTQGVEEMSASFVVGADGARGAVRKSLGVDFEGWTYDQRFLLLSTTFPFEDRLAELCHVNYMSDPDEFVMLLRIPDVWRVLVPVALDESEESATSPERLQAVLARILPSEQSWAGQVLQHQIYNVHQRVAARLHVGRVVLAGDAAHVNSPMGGFGLNSGIHDALDLSIRLRRILEGGNDRERVAAELDAYDASRRAVALEHVRVMSHRNTSMLTERDPNTRAQLIAEFRSLANDPAKARAWLLDASMINLVADQVLGALPA